LAAGKAMDWKLRDCLPAIQLSSSGPTPGIWETRRDLLASQGTALEFVVEVETEGTAYLRFGDDRFGQRPAAGTKFTATYRVGNGAAGNIGAKSLTHIASQDPLLVSDVADPVVLSVSNPLPASGGRNQESIAEVRHNAPNAFRVQERAVTPDDYAAMAERCDEDIQRAAGSFRWTGSWRTVFVSADRREGHAIDARFEDNLRDCLERYRMAGHDLEVNGPIYVPLEIEMSVCVLPDYFATDIQAALAAVFTNKTTPDGRKGVFHPDNFTFGQPVYMSRFIAAAQRVEGVSSVTVTVFQRQNQPDPAAFENRRLDLSRLEVARLDNDPNFPERGVFRLLMKGGR
jgi:predicted phage baseplate assembly protein